MSEREIFLGPLAFRSIAGLLHFLLIFPLFGTEILYFIIYHSEHSLVKNKENECSLAFFPASYSSCFDSPPFLIPILSLPLLLSSQISDEIAHVRLLTTQAKFITMRLSCQQYRVDVSALLIRTQS